MMQAKLPDLKSLRKKAKRFNLSNVFALPSNKCGVYIFIYGSSYVYVGQSRKQGVRERLLSHHGYSHNEEFRKWIEALGNNLRFTYFLCEDRDADYIERCLINKLQPITNSIRYKDFC
jgi:hypothetical protein